MQGTVNTIVGCCVLVSYFQVDNIAPGYIFILSIALLCCGGIMLLDFANYIFLDNYIRKKQLRHRNVGVKPITH